MKAGLTPLRSPIARTFAALAVILAAQSNAFAGPVQRPVGKPDAPPSSSPAIVGGTVAPPGSWPSTVSFQFMNSGLPSMAHGCGATLISARDILTAAHCVDGYESKYHHRILIGAQHLQKKGEPLQGKLYSVAWTIQHPNFTDTRFKPTDYDVAVLRLAEPVTDIAPMRLVASISEEKQIAPPGTTAWTAGWGAMGGAAQSTADLRQVDVPIVSTEACRNAGDLFGDMVTARMICAGGVKGKDSCTGDSGGPLIVHAGPNHEAVQVGIVSWGATTACGLEGYPAVYTRVAALRQWIQQQVDRP